MLLLQTFAKHFFQQAMLFFPHQLITHIPSTYRDITSISRSSRKGQKRNRGRKEEREENSITRPAPGLREPISGMRDHLLVLSSPNANRRWLTFMRPIRRTLNWDGTRIGSDHWNLSVCCRKCNSIHVFSVLSTRLSKKLDLYATNTFAILSSSWTVYRFS
jgi:hypothetical protein